MKKDININKTDSYQDLVDKSDKLFPETPWSKRQMNINCNTMGKYMHMLEIVNEEVQKQTSFFNPDRVLPTQEDNVELDPNNKTRHTLVALQKIGLVNILHQPNKEEQDKEHKENFKNYENN